MKILALNGSPNAKGNTYHIIKTMAAEFEKDDIEIEIIHVGNKSIRGCSACGMCRKNQDEKCILPGDEVNNWIQKMKNADGIILGSPVHFSSMSGTMKSFLDRSFYVSSANNGMLRHKVGASVVAVRRSGGLPTFNQLNNFLTFSEILIPTSNYWNIAHGTSPGEVLKDEEGMQIMRILAKNMIWLLKLVDNGKEIVKEPNKENKTYTNFIR